MSDLQCRKVDHTVNIWVGCKDFLQSNLIRYVRLVEVRSLAANKLNAIQRDFRGIVEIVYNNDFVAVFKKRKGGERSNISSATKEKPWLVSFLIIAAPEIRQAIGRQTASSNLPGDQNSSHRHDSCALHFHRIKD